jgi:hypothetical protein
VIIDLHGNWAPTVGSATSQTNYLDAHAASRQQAALALGGWDQGNTQLPHYPLLRKRIRRDKAMRALQDQWLQDIMPGLQALQHELSAAAPTHMSPIDRHAIQNTCDALRELGRVFLEALPLQISQHSYPLKHLESVKVVVGSPGWGEYSRQVLCLEKRSGGDVLNSILELQQEEDMDRQGPHQGPAATNLVHVTEAADDPDVQQHTTISAAPGQLHMQQPSSPAALVTDTVPQVLQQLGIPALQGLTAAHTLPVAQASGPPHAPPAAAQRPAFPWQVDMASMQHTMAMLAQQHAARATAAAPVHTTAATARQHKQPAYKVFVLEGKEMCGQVYTIVQYSINGAPSWRQHKAEAEAQGTPLHPTDRHQFSKYQPIIRAAEFAVQHSGLTEAQTLQALDGMQQQLASPPPRGSSKQRRKVGVSDMAYGFAYVQNLDTQIKALAQQRATGGKLHLPAGFEPKAMKDHSSSTTIRPDMQQSTGITVWEFIQHAAALNLCPQRAKEEWFDQCLPSMQGQRKRRLEQARQ